MKVINKKIMGILLCTLMIATIPMAAGMNTDNEKDTTDLFGWTVIRGLIFNIKKIGNDLYFRAIRLHATQFTPTEMSMRVHRFERLKISDFGPDRQITFGPLGSFTWIIGLKHGDLKEL